MKNILFFCSIALLTACNLTKEVDIQLPEYTVQPVVECYLEPGKPFRLLLTRSYGFFDPLGLDSSFLDKTLVSNALVTVTYNGQTDTLYNNFSVEPSPLKLFNYTGDRIVPATPGLEYVLNISLPNNGGQITGRTTMLPLVPIDSIVVEFGPKSTDSLARVLTYITDDRSTVDYYRRMLNYSNLDSLADQDFIFSDRTSTTEKIAFGTGYELERGDTVFNTVFHITKDYYDFYESVSLARAGNANPFAQPSAIRSNVSGTANPLGIFTCLVYDRKRTIAK